MNNKSAIKYFSDGILGTLLLAVFLLIIGSFLQAPIIIFAINLMHYDSALGTIITYLSFIGIWLSVCLFMLVNKRDRNLFCYITPSKTGNTFGLSIIGFLAGFGMNALCILFAVINDDISLYFYGGNLFLFIIAFIAVFVQSSAEELLVRVFLYQHLNRRYESPLVPIVLSSVFFTAMHLSNTGIGLVPIIDITVSGILFALMIYFFNSFYMAAFCHTTWNYTQAIVFGLPNSGNVTPFSLFKLEAVKGDSSFFYNPEFGIEGSWMSVLVQVIAIIIIVNGSNIIKRK